MPKPSIVMPALIQAGFFMAVWWACDALAKLLHLPLPGGVVGLFVVTALLLAGCLPQARIESGARLLLGEMLLFFTPPLMAVLHHPELLGPAGLKLALVIVVGTLVVMLAVATVVERAIRWESRRRAQPMPHAPIALIDAGEDEALQKGRL
ncbi:MAG TPA: CidA/LrgA family protein [Candidatus Aquabacterium excrementipullorum]|nr:CidA/LrgA family protein [Candidatus Aquabacterium excrementipullorum]